MELQDTTLKVLYDFEYSTKDGKFVRIQEGEKLFLIKKTNRDWWQVIRSSGKPFYVPASYVEVYRKVSNGNKNNLENIKPTSQKSRSHSEGNDKGGFVSVKERANSIDSNSNVKQKPKVAKRTIFPVIPSYENIPTDNEVTKEEASVIETYQNLTFNTRVIPIQDESYHKSSSPPEEEADYVNLRPDGNGFVIETELTNSVDSITESSVAQNENSSISLSLSSSSIPLPLNNSNSKLSTSSSKSSLDNQIDELDQVEGFPKTHSVSSTSLDGISRVYSEPTNMKIMKSVSSDDIKHYMNCNNNNVSRFTRSVSHEPSSLPHYNTVPGLGTESTQHKLSHNGSFKTKYEREKWARNHQVNESEEKKPEDKTRKKSLETVKESLNEISHTTYNFLDEDDSCETQEGKLNEEPESNNLVIEINTNSEQGTNVKNIAASFESQISASDDSIGIVSKKSEPFKVSLIDVSETKSNELSVASNEGLTNDPAASESELSGDMLSMSEKGSVNSLLELEMGKSIQSTDDGDMSSDEKRHTKALKDKENRKRGTGLIRNRRVESYKLRLPLKGTSPPPNINSPHLAPLKELSDGWSEYSTTDGRIYYCNKQTGEKSWNLPRKRCNTDEDGARSEENPSGSSSPFGDGEEVSSPITDVPSLPLPQGWAPHIDLETGLACYVNSLTGAKWFSSNDIEGRVYFFEENSSESSWTLPEVNPTNVDVSSTGIARSSSQELVDSNVPPTRHKPPSGHDRNLRNAKARSMILFDPTKKPLPLVAEPPIVIPSLSKHWPQLWDGHMCILKEGTLVRTKITEHGKRLKKNWSTSHVVLTELFLLFFKDVKQFNAMKTGGCVGSPELCVDLNGALIERGDKLSSRRHVFLISTVLMLQVLIQFDSSSQSEAWLHAIHIAIKNLPSGVDNCSRIFKNPSVTYSPESSDSKKSKICRSKSVKLKKEGSIEDLPSSSAERQTKIKARLKKFFNRRPTMDHLVKKGIYKDEPAFGGYLEKVCPNEPPRVPLFVQRCIQCIEKSEDNMKTDGLYRASGNLSQVQKIRLQVDQNNLSVLDEEEDVHVLAGALKLFFRELKEPLIPYHAFHKALKASTNHNRKDKLLLFRDIIRSLPSPNHDTFKFLLQHLLRITKYKDFNRMHIPNLAIVFGPTLMWSEQESKNMAFDFMQQNLVIEYFLVEFDNVFR
uniref:Rho GTPase-activating protein 12 n=1 Tax=Cacopsylla melanoneura TaxID=428564 RepID=A0A8D8LL24_9HEMI